NPSPFLNEIPEDVKEEVRLASASRYGSASAEPSWRERPIQRGYGDNYRGYSNAPQTPARRPYAAGSGGAPQRPPQPQPRPATPPPQPRKNESVNGVLSFFKDAPVQFDPGAIQAAKSQPAPAGAAAELKRGQRVQHEQFGIGTILTMEGSGPDAKLTVYFDRHGSKKFIARFAKLTRV
ncbi:MAG TPA: hypothetical protein VF698_01125, partial [Thermoanaerobaculia bacterium]